MTACNNFREHLWKKEICRECQQPKSDHKSTPAADASAAPSEATGVQGNMWKKPSATAATTTPAVNAVTNRFNAPTASATPKVTPVVAATPPTSKPVIEAPKPVVTTSTPVSVSVAASSSTPSVTSATKPACSGYEVHAFKPGKCKNCGQPESTHGAHGTSSNSTPVSTKPVASTSSPQNINNVSASNNPFKKFESSTPSTTSGVSNFNKPILVNTPKSYVPSTTNTVANRFNAPTVSAAPKTAPVVAATSASTPSVTSAPIAASTPANAPAVAFKAPAATVATTTPVTTPASTPSTTASTPKSSTGGCGNFVAHAFKKNQCRNCYQSQDAHSSSPTTAAPATAATVTPATVSPVSVVASTPTPVKTTPFTAAANTFSAPTKPIVNTSTPSSKPACDQYKEHNWKKEVCGNCQQKKADHATSALTVTITSPATSSVSTPSTTGSVSATAARTFNAPSKSFQPPTVTTTTPNSGASVSTPSSTSSAATPSTPSRSSFSAPSNKTPQKKVGCALFVPGAIVKSVCSTCSHPAHEHEDAVIRRSRENSFSSPQAPAPGEGSGSASNSRKNSISGGIHPGLYGVSTASAPHGRSPSFSSANLLPKEPTPKPSPKLSPSPVTPVVPVTDLKSETMPDGWDPLKESEAAAAKEAAATGVAVPQTTGRVSNALSDRIKRMSLGGAILNPMANMPGGPLKPRSNTMTSGMLSGADFYGAESAGRNMFGQIKSPPSGGSNTNADGSPQTEVADVDPLASRPASGSFARPTVGGRAKARPTFSAPKFNAPTSAAAADSAVAFVGGVTVVKEESESARPSVVEEAAPATTVAEVTKPEVVKEEEISPESSASPVVVSPQPTAVVTGAAAPKTFFKPPVAAATTAPTVTTAAPAKPAQTAANKAASLFGDDDEDDVWGDKKPTATASTSTPAPVVAAKSPTPVAATVAPPRKSSLFGDDEEETRPSSLKSLSKDESKPAPPASAPKPATPVKKSSLFDDLEDDDLWK